MIFKNVRDQSPRSHPKSYSQPLPPRKVILFLSHSAVFPFVSHCEMFDFFFYASILLIANHMLNLALLVHCFIASFI